MQKWEYKVVDEIFKAGDSLELNHVKSDPRASVASNENLTQPGEQFQTLLSYEETFKHVRSP